MVGAGVARVELNETTLNVTVAERYGEKGIWWLANDNPRYGDISAYRDERGDYNYLLGGAPNGIQDYRNQQYVYQARVPHKEAFNLSAYEYWHGRGIGWSPKLLKTFNSETAVMWNTGQGQMYWNNYLECYLFVHTSKQATPVCSDQSH